MIKNDNDNDHGEEDCENKGKRYYDQRREERGVEYEGDDEGEGGKR